ncbi:MAG TPA: adenosylmethionine--8-amino-7-oxononanoate transaminase [Burkholderiales bacterium]|nr:adenosylmethionine--8-amino-7-oxononanoate transaminase [Burkholderiales bacterium]
MTLANEIRVQRSLAAVWHPCTQMKQHEQLPLVPIARGQGAWLFDFDDRRFLDAIGSWWVNLFGHANPRINEALIAQLGKLEHVMLAGFTHEPVIDLSERLGGMTGRRLGHCFYASDGASAIEIALKMSFHFWRNEGKADKQDFVCLKGSYHGETLGALSVTDVALFRDAYAPLLRQCNVVESPDWRNAAPGESPQAYAVRCAQTLERYMEQHHQRTAALIVEPLVQCATGMAMYDAEYLRQARAICDRYEVHLIADEIAVGCGRTGSFFACEQADIWPDFLCMSKGLSGGYLPLSVVLSTDAIYECFYDDNVARGFLHSHSYTGNPLACAAAVATLDIFEDDKVLDSNAAMGAHMHLRFQAIAQHPRVRNFRRTGMIFAFEVHSSEVQFAREFYAAALKQELLLRPIGNTVYFMPPYIINEEEVAFLAERTLGLLDQVAG